MQVSGGWYGESGVCLRRGGDRETPGPSLNLKTVSGMGITMLKIRLSRCFSNGVTAVLH